MIPKLTLRNFPSSILTTTKIIKIYSNINFFKHFTSITLSLMLIKTIVNNQIKMQTTYSLLLWLNNFLVQSKIIPKDSIKPASAILVFPCNQKENINYVWDNYRIEVLNWKVGSYNNYRTIEVKFPYPNLILRKGGRLLNDAMIEAMQGSELMWDDMGCLWKLEWRVQTRFGSSTQLKMGKEKKKKEHV